MITSMSLLDRVADRQDAEAWQRLIDLYLPLIRGWICRLQVSLQDADDCAQEVLSVVVRELPHFQHNGRPGAFRAWLRTITVNRVREHWRRCGEVTAQGRLMSTLDQLEDPHSDLARRWDQEHDAYVVKKLLESVKEECRPTVWQAFSRQVLDGMTAERVAAELNTTANAVLIAKSRVLRLLRQRGQALVGEP
jgi:RNA polymerase sigma-70 factor (ECF subfamily)